MKGVFIKDITYEQCKEHINEKTIVVLPIGGGSKEHGDHLPMGTDFMVTNWIAEKVTELFPVVTLPTLPYAYFPAFVEWKGSVSIGADHFINFVKDIILSFARFGVKKFLIIDGGVSTHLPLMVLSGTMNNDYNVKVAVSNVNGLGKEVHDEVCTQSSGGHGDEAETSCMLHINSSLVHMDKTVEEYSTNIPGATKNGVQKVYFPGRMTTHKGTNGNSTLATEEKGQRILNAMVDDLLIFLESFAAYEG